MISALVQSVFSEAAQVLKPPPKLLISEWAEREFILSSEDSAEPGRFRLSRTPYLRGILDSVLDPRVEEIVLFTAAQCAKTTALKIILGYFMKEDPSGTLYMMPTLDDAKKWSRGRLAPMMRDVPALRGLIGEGARKGENNTLFKTFPGGFLNIVGANSPSSLTSWPTRLVLADEEDHYPLSAGSEGDPVSLAAERTTTFWNRKIVHSSTCTIKGLSRIEAKYLVSNKQRYFVPCPGCGEFQALRWDRLVKDIEQQDPEPVYPCEACGLAITEFDKPKMLNAGEWRAERPEVTRTAGFWLSAMYSPFTSWSQMVVKFREAKRERENPEKLKTFINLSLAETWEEQGEVVEYSELERRREHYPPPALPDGVTVVTGGVDVQGDRLELEVVGWGKGEESWGVDVQLFEGDTAKSEVWDRLDDYLLNSRFLHARGVYLDIAAVFVDSGFRANEVYRWTGARNDRRIYASKGMSGWRRPPLGPYTRANRHKVKMYPVGVDVIKEIVYARLRLTEAGAGYMHFSLGKHTQEYFRQLTAERLVKKYQHGFPVRYWEKPAGARNEALDMRVYAYAAFLSLSTNPAAMLEHLRRDLLAQARQQAQIRRLKVDPNQLSFLEKPLEAAAAVPEAVAQTSAQNEAAPQKSEEKDVSLGAEEYKAAEVLDATEQKPAVRRAPPRITFNRRW